MSSTIISDFYSCNCGRKGIPLPRRAGSEREAGHLKRLYCIYCAREWNHAEVKPFTKYSFLDFKTEWEYDNFDEYGNRRMPYGELRGKIHDGKIQKKKTLSPSGGGWFGQEYVDTE